MSDIQLETPLARKLKERLAREAMSVGAFVEACLHDPDHGYYRHQEAIGKSADFITAPEISQVFGELLGLWSAITWKAMGSPETVNLVEIGPGRGTMMKDALRALNIVPAFRSAVHVHLIESNPVLCDIQRETLKNESVPSTWHRDLNDALGTNGAIAEAPTIILANEFLDTLPVGQFARADDAWVHRDVVLADGDFSIRNSTAHCELDIPSPLAAQVQPDDIFEVCTGFAMLAQNILAERASRAPLAALFIDYGHITSGFGDSLQAVKDHKAVSLFHAPGESDLTAQVDFQAFTKQCLAANVDGKRPLEVDGPITQAAFLGALGIAERTFRLMASNPEIAGRLETGVARLMAPIGMGGRFKVCAVRSKTLSPLIGIA